VGISAGCAYGLQYFGSGGCSKLTCNGIPDDSIRSFCAAGDQLFFSAGGNTYRYQMLTAASDFDLDDLQTMTPSSTASDVDAARLI